MAALQEKLINIVRRDPAVALYASQVGAGTGGQQGNDGRMFINLKPWDQRPGDDVMKAIARLSQKVQGVPDVQLFMQPAQDIDVVGRLSRTLYQYTLQDADSAELNTWAHECCSACRRCRNCETSPRTSRSAVTTATINIDRSAAQRFGIEPRQLDDTLYDAFG